jgi:hypothetical protein
VVERRRHRGLRIARRHDVDAGRGAHRQGRRCRDNIGQQLARRFPQRVEPVQHFAPGHGGFLIPAPVSTADLLQLVDVEAAAGFCEHKRFKAAGRINDHPPEGAITDERIEPAEQIAENHARRRFVGQVVNATLVADGENDPVWR